MTKRILKIAWQRTAHLGRDDDGAALVITLAVFLLLFIMVSAVYAVGENIRQKIELQNACDAAAYSAAVVQADGLSRMAVVNKAMSWTYVQMCKRQMDYITYRFLRLTEQRFIEDYNNAKAYHAYMSFYKFGYYPIPTGSGMSCKGKHKKESIGWWCGLGAQDQHKKLRINGKTIDLAELQEALKAFGSQWDEDGTNYANPDNTSDGPDIAMEEADASNVYPHLRQYYNELEINSLLAQFNAANSSPFQRLPVTDKNDPSFQSWLNSQNYQPVTSDNDPRYLAWLKQKGYSGYTETEEGETIEYSWQDVLDGKLIEKFSAYTGEQKPSEPGDNASDDEWNQWAVAYNNFILKFNAWVKELNYEQCVYLAFGAGNSQVAATIPRSVPSGVTLQTYTPPQAPTQPPAVALSGPAAWGAKLGKLIDRDKHSIQMMSASLSAINSNMALSMRDTARLVLERNLKASYPEGLSDFICSISIPSATDPYETLNSSDPDSTLSFYFSALNNTEAGERVFLEMGESTHGEKTNLAAYFGSSDANGLDQWFIRGGVTGYKDSAVAGDSSDFQVPEDTVRFGADATQGGEGTPGIMRVYKSANINETGAGFLYNAMARGNHYFSLNIPALNTNSSTGGGTILGELFNKFKEAVLKSLFDQLQNTAQQIVDCSPSCENIKESGGNSNYAMCREVSDSRALYAEYDWASAKWWCFWKLKHFKKKWKAHFPFPKWFCGSYPKSIRDVGSSTINLGPLNSFLDIFPPIGAFSLENTHGYLDNIWDMVAFVKQFKPMLEREGSCSREDYKSCIISPDDMTFILKGHARVYGDDMAVWDSRYAGIPAKPWVLNEKFFNGQGTIVIGVAKKHGNPFFWMSANSDTEINDPKFRDARNIKNGIFKFFNPPAYMNTPANYIVAMSAARAAVKHGGDREYRISYDDSADADKLHSNDPEGWMPLDNTPGQPQIHIGCVCGRVNHGKMRGHWNLSAVDWDATLLPLRYARSRIDNNVWCSIDDNVMEDNPFLNSVWSTMEEFSSPRPDGIPKSEQHTGSSKYVIDPAKLLNLKIY